MAHDFATRKKGEYMNIFGGFVLLWGLSFQIAAIGNSSSDVRVQDLQKKCDDLQKKLDCTNTGSVQVGSTSSISQPSGGARKKTVKFAAEPETVIAPDMDDRVQKLECALEAAAKERQEILEAAEKEIEYHRSIGK